MDTFEARVGRFDWINLTVTTVFVSLSKPPLSPPRSKWIPVWIELVIVFYLARLWPCLVTIKAVPPDNRPKLSYPVPFVVFNHFASLTFINAKLCLTDLRLTSLTKSGVRVCGPDDVYFRHAWPGTRVVDGFLRTDCLGVHGDVTLYTDNNERVYSFHGCYA